MFLPLLILLFLAMPLIELALLLKVGSAIGPAATITLVVVTGILGAALARAQGFAVINRVRQELSAGRLPASEMVDGLLIFIGGLVLLTPGLITDALGFSLLIPWVRSGVKLLMSRKFSAMVVVQKRAPLAKDDVIDI